MIFQVAKWRIWQYFDIKMTTNVSLQLEFVLYSCFWSSVCRRSSSIALDNCRYLSVFAKEKSIIILSENPPLRSTSRFVEHSAETSLSRMLKRTRWLCICSNIFFYFPKNVGCLSPSPNDLSGDIMKDSPRRSSPKFPQPIFLPTRKFGPTMSTPDDEVTLCRDECTFDRAALPLPLEVRLATSWSRSELRAPSSLSPRLSLPSRFCISYRPLLSTVAAI